MAEQNLEVLVGTLLKENKLRLAVAESCTGGLVAHLLTEVSGSSAYFSGGVVAYDNEIKERLLGVRRETLVSFGAVSRETAVEMARGVRLSLGTDIGLSTTGIAGPDGGTVEKPVGLVWIGLSRGNKESAWSFIWEGDRQQNKLLTAHKALEMLIESLMEQIKMEHIEVTPRFNGRGRIMPVRFIWKGRHFNVDSTGRRWVDEEGQHMLVMVPGGRVFHLLFRKDGLWFLLPRPGAQKEAS